MTRRTRQDGYTLVEFVVGGFVGLVVVIALGHLLLANQRSWHAGQEKVRLQQNASQAADRISRAVRAAHRLAVVDGDELRIFDAQGVQQIRYRCVGHAGEGRLRENGRDLVAQRCRRFRVVPDADTTSVGLEIELENEAGQRVAVATRVARRNQTAS
ncbi:MAG: hypothetical protein GF330_08100 [Candidatus Eisenbacteria bacterium]|nr:hypothetical protein [Candidatus Eisenbacteria bacterium]